MNYYSRYKEVDSYRLKRLSTMRTVRTVRVNRGIESQTIDPVNVTV